jgi:hypothetical protein
MRAQPGVGQDTLLQALALPQPPSHRAHPAQGTAAALNKSVGASPNLGVAATTFNASMFTEYHAWCPWSP